MWTRCSTWRPPCPQPQQREAFQGLVTGALGEDCSFDTVQAVQGRAAAMIQEHKESKGPEPATCGT